MYVGPDLDSICHGTPERIFCLTLRLKEILEEVDFEKNQQTTRKPEGGGWGGGGGGGGQRDKYKYLLHNLARVHGV